MRDGQAGEVGESREYMFHEEAVRRLEVVALAAKQKKCSNDHVKPEISLKK